MKDVKVAMKKKQVNYKKWKDEIKTELTAVMTEIVTAQQEAAAAAEEEEEDEDEEEEEESEEESEEEEEEDGDPNDETHDPPEWKALDDEVRQKVMEVVWIKESKLPW